MRNKVLWAVIAVVATLGALLVVSLGGLLGWYLVRPAQFGAAWPSGMMGGRSGPGGMMGGRSGSGGMMGGWSGPGGMMGGWSGPDGMMGGWFGRGGCYGSEGSSLSGGEAVLGFTDAQEAVEGYLRSLGLPDLEVAEVMEFSNHFYAEVEEDSTGVHAMELLIDKSTGVVYPEHGPNMMWNTKYGMHSGSGWGGMMGRFGGAAPSPDMPISADQALQYAQRYLDNYAPGAQAGGEADAFYGYYTIHVSKNAQVYGMLSVNGYGGEVWYHDWHGQFVDMMELDEG